MNPFQAAMIATELEDAADSPCLLCGASRVTGVGLWLPNRDCSRRLGAPEGKIRACPYGLCQGCQRLPDVVTRVEDYFLGRADRERAILAAGWEVDGALAHLPDRPIPAWVHEALGCLPGNPGRLPTGTVFIWREDPRCVHVRTAEGEVLTLAEPGVVPPEAPGFLRAGPPERPRRRRPDFRNLQKRKRRRR